MGTKAKELRQELEQEQEKARQEMEVKLQIIGDLPDSIPTPTISNIKLSLLRSESSVNSRFDTLAWVSFTFYSYRMKFEEWNPVAILEAFEAIGWEPIPTSLCRYDNYQPGVKIGTVEECKAAPLPGTYRELRGVSAITPAWFTAGNYGESKYCCFLTRLGKTIRVNVSVPGVLRVSAERVNLGRDDWQYLSGSAKCGYPEAWADLPGLTPTAAGYVDSAKSVRGVLYFWLQTPQKEWTTKASVFLQQLLDAKKTQGG